MVDGAINSIALHLLATFIAIFSEQLSDWSHYILINETYYLCPILFSI